MTTENKNKPATLVFTIPAVTQHQGVHTMTVTIQAECPKCGLERAIRTWKGHSYDGEKSMLVDMWENACGHTDTYEEVREEFFRNPIGIDNSIIN